MAIKNILKYLKRTEEVFLVYVNGDLMINEYTDANFQTNRDDSNILTMISIHIPRWGSFLEDFQ